MDFPAEGAQNAGYWGVWHGKREEKVRVMIKFRKKFLKAVLGAAAFLVLLVLGYCIYMLATYHRIEDKQVLSVRLPAEAPRAGDVLQKDEEYEILTYNIGFGAYTPDFSFFMDGGKSSWAKSKESVIETVQGAANLVDGINPDFILMQEIDLDSTRSYHVNQYELINGTFDEYYSSFAVNYDSSFLAYPFTQPHGKCYAGIALYAKYPITGSLRRSLPISASLSKFVDLDRCYSISRIPTESGKELVLINIHMSAYGNDASVRQKQIATLCADLQKEYEAGNYVICGGDFNHNLKAHDYEVTPVASWAYPFPRKELPEHFRFALDSFAQRDLDALWDSSRNADMEWILGETLTVTLDGFIISDNVQCIDYKHIKTGYSYSDHEPVVMRFKLR